MPRPVPTRREGPSSSAPGSLTFEAVHARFAGVVHGIAVARVGPDDADDVCQEVFAAVHRRLGEVRDPNALPGWVCAIARHAAIDVLRRRRRRPARAGEDLDALPAQDAAAGASDGELARRVLACIRALPEAYRETLVLRLVEGLTGPEIAERTGLTHGSVRVNLCRGMALLRPALRAEGWS